MWNACSSPNLWSYAFFAVKTLSDLREYLIFLSVSGLGTTQLGILEVLGGDVLQSRDCLGWVLSRTEEGAFLQTIGRVIP